MHAEVVVVGGGIVGCSTAYHLAKLGCRDVLLLEQGRLTGGTTWHAAGLVGQMRPTRNMTRMSRYGIELYSSLEAETGLATGWRQCGSLNVAASADRMTLFRRQMARARSFGVEFEFVTPREVGERVPLLRTEDLVGAVWIPGDGKANPTDLTQSLARGARMHGARIVEGARVVGVQVESGRVAGVRARVRDASGLQAGPGSGGVPSMSSGAPGAEGRPGRVEDAGLVAIRCEKLVNCAGQWARELGRMAGVSVPLYSAEHFYVVTKPIPGVARDMPVIRDPDGFIYYKEEVGGLVMGGFEPVAKPWNVDPIPEGFEFQLLPEDWDQFEILMRNAIHRTPCLEAAEVKLLLNGPESFTGDGNFVLGEAPEVRNYFVAAGFNSAGIANAGGAGRLIAEWVMGGEAPLDLWDVDIRRFAPLHANRAHLRDRTVETLGLHYAMRWPREELRTVRPLRRSPLYDRLAAKGAVFGSKLAWERANYFLPAGAREPAPTMGTPEWLPWVLEEQRAAREAVAVFDQTSFAKLVLKGRDALAVLQRLCANDIDVPVGRMVYTALLNRRGGFESDLTVTRLADDTFFLVTGSAQGTRDADWIGRHVDRDEFAVLVDVTSGWSVISVMGPKSAELLARVSPDDLSKAALPFSTTRDIDVGYARVRAARMSYIGGAGFELYVPADQAATAYDALFAAGGDLGLRDAGYYTIDALRIEAGRRAWGAELGPDETPWEAGLAHAVRLDKAHGFLGREALLAQRREGCRKRLLRLVFDDPRAFPWGGEPITFDDRPVGELTSAGYSGTLGRAVALGYARGTEPITDEALAGVRVAVDIAGERQPVTARIAR